MKYFAALFVVFTLIIPSVSFAAPFDKNLYYGMKSDSDVQALQEFLTEQGDYAGPITGNFFALTLQAVKNFQNRNAVKPVSGYFGVLSRGVANSLITIDAPVEEVGTTTEALFAPTVVNQVTGPAPTLYVPETVAPAPQVVFAPIAPQFVGNPHTTVEGSIGSNMVSFYWDTDVPTISTFELCQRKNDECVVQYTSDETVGHSLTIMRPANRMEFYRIILKDGGYYSSQVPQ